MSQEADEDYDPREQREVASPRCPWQPPTRQRIDPCHIEVCRTFEQAAGVVPMLKAIADPTRLRLLSLGAVPHGR